MTKLEVAPRPCVSCPYRLDVPSGVWAESEYEKLRKYDDEYGNASLDTSVFHCHQEHATNKPTVCRGWLSVHAESVAVRLAMANGLVTPDEVYAEPLVPLHPSGNAAADFGERDIEAPSPESTKVAEKVVRTLPGIQLG